MKFFSYVLVLSVFAVILYLVISLVRFAYIRIKAYVIRRRLVKRSESEQKDD